MEPRLPSSRRLSCPPSHVIPHTVFRQSSEEETQTSWILQGGGLGWEQKEVCLFLAVGYLRGPTPDSGVNSPRASDFCPTDSVGLRTSCWNQCPLHTSSLEDRFEARCFPLPTFCPNRSPASPGPLTAVPPSSPSAQASPKEPRSPLAPSTCTQTRKSSLISHPQLSCCSFSLFPPGSGLQGV